MKKVFIIIFAFMILILTGCSGKVMPSDNGESSKNKDTSVIQTLNNVNNDKLSVSDVAASQVEIILKRGDNGDKVIDLQKKLYTLGFDIAVDGVYGIETSKFIMKIQKSNNMDQSGNLDKKTDEIIKGMKGVRAYNPPKIMATPAAVEKKSIVEAPKGLTTIPNISTSIGDAQQVIVILASSYGTIHANFNTYEKINGYWQVVNSGNAVTGIKGFSDNKHEGDLTSPTGKYGIPFLFGNANNPGAKLSYRKVQPGDYWVSNKIIDEYNVWMHYDGSDPDGRLYDYEALWKQPLYNYAVVIDYNYGVGKVMGKGSGIFLHIAPPGGGGTLGCIGVSETNLVQIIKWLDPAKKPIIIMGVKGHI